MKENNEKRISNQFGAFVPVFSKTKQKIFTRNMQIGENTRYRQTA